MFRPLVALTLIACTAGVGACAAFDPDRLAPIEWNGDGASMQPMGGRDGGNVPSDAGHIDTNDDASANDDGGVEPRNDSGVVGQDAGLSDASAAEDASVDADVVDGEVADGEVVDAEVVDECPSDPNKTTAGTCGCGVAEVCQGLIDTIVHRYGFEESGTTITDAVGSADGEASNALPGTGALTLSGGDYAALPAGLISSLAAATIELWWTWQGGAADQRLISFGTVLPNTPGDSACNGTSTQYHEGSWYRFCKNATRTGAEAWNMCSSAGGYLIAIESAAEQQYMADHPDWASDSVWIGANDIQTDGQWHHPSVDGRQGGGLFWIGGASGSAAPGAYANWLAGEPANTSTKDCVFMQRSTRQWWAWECTTNVAHAMCEWRGHRGTAMDRGVWFSPSNGAGRPSLSYAAGAGTAVATGASAFPVGALVHIALVLDPVGGSIALFVDGAQVASAPSTATLSGLRDGDNWLGRSHVSSNPSLIGALNELRIYSAALTPEQIAASHAAGPDPAFLP